MALAPGRGAAEALAAHASRLRAAVSVGDPGVLSAVALEIATSLEDLGKHVAAAASAVALAAASLGLAGGCSAAVAAPAAAAPAPALGKWPVFSVGGQERDKSYVTSLAVLASDRIASAAENGRISLWKLEGASGSLLRCFKAHDKDVNALSAFGPDTLASGSDDGTVKVWESLELGGVCRQTLNGFRRGVTSLARLPGADGAEDMLISGCKNRDVKLFNMGTGELVTTFGLDFRDSAKEGHRDIVLCVAAVAPGIIASGSQDKTARLWDVAGQCCSGLLEGHKNGVCAVAAVRGQLATGSKDKTVRLWSLDTKECLCTLEGHESHVRGFALLARREGGPLLASASADLSLRVWDLDAARPECLATLGGRHGQQGGHTDAVNAVVQLAGRLVSCGDDCLLRVWSPPEAAGCCGDGPSWAALEPGDAPVAAEGDAPVAAESAPPAEAQAPAPLQGYPCSTDRGDAGHVAESATIPASTPVLADPS